MPAYSCIWQLGLGCPSSRPQSSDLSSPDYSSSVPSGPVRERVHDPVGRPVGRTLLMCGMEWAKQAIRFTQVGMK